MENPDQVSKDIAKLEAAVKELQQVCVKASNLGDPETLSQKLMELGRVNSALGRRAKSAVYIARTAEHAYKKAREQYKIDAIADGKSATFGDTQRYLKSTGDHDVWAKAAMVAEQADDLAYRTSDFMKMAQSRLSLIKGDIRG